MIPYLVTDTETTGLDPATDKLVEIAGVWREDDGPMQIYESLCNPGRDIPPQARAVHHISPDDVKDASSPAGALARLLDLAVPKIVQDPPMVFVAHNAEFDRSFLAALSSGFVEQPWVCTWRCAMHLWPSAPSHSNQVLRYWLGLEPVLPKELYPHRALYDTIVTEAILRKMLETTSLQELLRLSYEPVVLETVRFGKHRGAKWNEVPRDYLHWVVKQQDMDKDVRHTAMYWLRPQQPLL
jgi:exodeoxyribonuclease X